MKIRPLLALASLSLISLVHAEAPVEVSGATFVTIEQAKQLFDEGAVFIDVRDRDAWKTGHIDGALNLDLEADEFSVLSLSKDLDRSTPIVFYTSSPLTVNGAVASYVASQWGYSHVYYFRDGYYAWLGQDYPAELPLGGRLGQGSSSLSGDMVVTR